MILKMYLASVIAASLLVAFQIRREFNKGIDLTLSTLVLGVVFSLFSVVSMLLMLVDHLVDSDIVLIKAKRGGT